MGRWQIKIVLPSLLTVGLFVVAIFVVILPTVKSSILDRKRETLQMLTQTAWSELNHFHRLEQSKQLTRRQAKKAAIESIRAMRYGPENKDYFWLNDYSARMVMHPYRPELEGKELSSFVDANGKRIFVAFAKTARSKGSGFVGYVWQWKDNPNRVVPKLSYVKGFAPWKWVVGTGIYLEDVELEIAALTKKLLVISSAILGLIALLSLVVITSGMRVDRERRRAKAELHAANMGLEARVKRRTTELQQVNKQLAHLAITDGLLGCYNHRHFQSSVTLEVERSNRTGQPLSLLMIDVDYFKKYNDTHGHPAGDKVLCQVTKILQRGRRANDVVARYGGEEFAILLIDTDGEAALKVAERVCGDVAEETFENEDSQPDDRLTITIGVASCPADAKTPKALIAVADAALCRGKQNGRNRVEAGGQDGQLAHG